MMPGMPTTRGRGRHRGSVEGDDMSAMAHHHSEPIGGQAMPGDHDACDGGDVTTWASDGMADDYRGGCELRWYRAAVVAVGHQHLAKHGALLGNNHRIRGGRKPLQRFGLGDDSDRGAHVGGGPDAGIATHPGKAFTLAWACSTVVSSARVRHRPLGGGWLTFSTTPLRLPRRAGQIATAPRSGWSPRRNEAVTRPLPVSQTVAIRSNRQTRVTPPSSRVTLSSSAATRCG